MSRSVARSLPLVGVDILDLTMEEALALILRALAEPPSPPCSVYFVNAHTLELASEDPRYHGVLRAGNYVFGDGTGVRWAVRHVHGVGLRDNVNGTDLVPRLLRTRTTPRGRYYLLGATPSVAARAADAARRLFPEWELAGFHHGYVDIEDCDEVIAAINAARADLLLLGMGNPKQELWVHENRKRLDVAVCCAVGGLFDYWGGGLDRAPTWMRRVGIEWMHLMLRQPRKLRRYLVGGPRFLIRVARGARAGQRRG